MSNLELDEGSTRLYTPCSTFTSKFKTEQLIVTCNRVCGGRFYARRCLHIKSICHQTSIVHTDGACSNNGKSDAVAGIGIAFGTHNGGPEDEDTSQFSTPVDDGLDPGGKRTSQRAELLAALEGLKKICGHDEERMSGHPERHEHDRDVLMVIITTDSEYVDQTL